MKSYFKRLQGHPGITTASMMTAAFVMVAPTHGGPAKAAITVLIASALVWLPVLITARAPNNKNKQ